MASTNLSLSYKQDIWDVVCSVTENSASGNNRSISLEIKVRTKDFTGGRDGKYHVDCSDGEDVAETNAVIPGSSQSYLVIYNDTFDVYVEPGQTYADMSLDFEVSFYSSSAGANRYLNGSISKISGLSIISDTLISSVSNTYFGDSVGVTWTPQSKSFAYKLKFVLGEYSYTTGVLTPNRTTAYTYSDLVIPLDAASNIPDSDYGIVTVTLTQYKDSRATETVGSPATKRFYIGLKDTVVPTISSYKAEFDNNANSTIKNWNIGLIGYSSVKLTASAIGTYGSTISSFEITGSYEASPIAKYENEADKTVAYLEYTGEKFTASGNKAFTIRCVDSRGRKSEPVEIKNSISILPYEKPKVISVSTVKNDNNTTATDDDVMVVTAKWQYDPIEYNGVKYNSASAKVYYKESKATTWTEHPGTIANESEFSLTSLHLEDEKAYNIKVVVTDAVGEFDDKSSFSSTTQVLLDFRAGGKGLGIGKICESDGMEVQMDATFYNDVYIRKESEMLTLPEYISSVINMSDILNAVYPIGSVYVSLSGTNPSLLFGGTWEQIRGRFLLASGKNDANTDTTYGDLAAGVIDRNAGEMGGEVTHTLTTDEMPAHTHRGVRRNYADRPESASTGASSGSADSSNETDPTGGGLAHNNMPPYLAVYMWRRTA